MTLLYAWLASISTGLEPLVLKASSKSLIKSPWLLNVLWIGATYPLIIPLMLALGAGLPQSWGIFIALGLAHATFFLLYTYSLYKIDVSTMGPLFSLRTAFALLLGIFILGDHITALQLGLILLIIAASPLAAYDEHLGVRAFKNRYVFLAVLAMAALAFAGFYTSKAYSENGFATTVLWQDTFTLLFLLPSLWFVDWGKESYSNQKLLPFTLLGVLGFIYVAASSVAYGKAYTLSTVIVSLPLSMIFVWIASKRYSDWLEYHPPFVYRVRFAGAAIMVASAIILSLL